jgi:hypothetical protein
MKPNRTTLYLSLAAGLVVGCLLAGTALAHHGWTGYDSNKTLTLTGVITQSEYINPHGMIRFQDSGKNWVAVLAPVSRMNSRGLSQEMLKVGTTVTVVGYPHLEKTEEMRAERITVAGKTVELR